MMYLVLVVLGLCLGSFVNALVWRVHHQMNSDGAKGSSKKQLAEKAKYSILSGRSMCPHCKHELAAKDLIPVISWVLLKGKCRYCRKGISRQYPLVELLTTVLFVASYALWPEPLASVQSYVFFGFWLVFLTGFMALAVYDLKWLLLPNRIVFTLMALAGLRVLLDVFVFGGGVAAALSAIWGVAISSGIFYVIYRIANEANREWIGFGDIKLGVVLGLVLGGPWNSILLLFISSLLGTLVSLPLLLSKKAKRSSLIPYGPFLIAAAIIIQLFGHVFVGWLDLLVMPR